MEKVKVSGERKVVKELEAIPGRVEQVLERRGKRLSHKYPVLFGLLASFGLVSVFYGFEHIIDRVPFLKENPLLMLLFGILLLIITGTLHKRISETAR